ncbi:MAG: substrate-binding periplasmic protein [Parvibaculaceae bacterium]
MFTWTKTIAMALAMAGVLLAAVALTAAQATAGTLQEVKNNGVLRVAGVIYRPLILRRPNGEYQGIDIEILGGFAAANGVKLEIIDTGWDTAVAGLGSGKWDVVPAICVTPARQEVVDFSSAVMQLGGVLVVLKDNAEINSIADANKPGVVFADMTGTWNEAISLEAFPQAQHKTFGQSSDEQMVLELMSGRADAIITDSPVTVSLILEKFGDKFRFFPGKDKPLDVQPCPVAYAIAKGAEDLQTALSAHIAELKASGKIDELYKKYLTSEYILTK